MCLALAGGILACRLRPAALSIMHGCSRPHLHYCFMMQYCKVIVYRDDDENNIARQLQTWLCCASADSAIAPAFQTPFSRQRTRERAEIVEADVCSCLGILWIVVLALVNCSQLCLDLDLVQRAVSHRDDIVSDPLRPEMKGAVAMVRSRVYRCRVRHGICKTLSGCKKKPNHPCSREA
jgi:hypothetical protein